MRTSDPPAFVCDDVIGCGKLSGRLVYCKDCRHKSDADECKATRKIMNLTLTTVGDLVESDAK